MAIILIVKIIKLQIYFIKHWGLPSTTAKGQGRTVALGEDAKCALLKLKIDQKQGGDGIVFQLSLPRRDY
jgi:hypothetical protein